MAKKEVYFSIFNRRGLIVFLWLSLMFLFIYITHASRWSHSQKQWVRGVLSKSCFEIYSKFTGKHPCRSVISIKLLCNFFEITLRYGCYPVNLLHIFGTPFTKNTSGWLLLNSAILFIFFRTITRLLPIMLAKSQSAPAKPASSRGIYFLSCSKLLNIISLHVSPHIISH